MGTEILIHGHIVKGWDDDKKQHYKCFEIAIKSDLYDKTSYSCKSSIEDADKTSLDREKEE